LRPSPRFAIIFMVLLFAVVFFASAMPAGFAQSTDMPVASFTANTTSGLAPLTVQFTDTSSNTPTSWLWDFGDGNASTDQNPVYTYAVAGNYSVSLTATNAAGNNIVTTSNYITVQNPALPTVTASLNGGTYSTTQTVILTCNDPSATIYYANDTTDPRNSSTKILYTGPITISNTTTLRYAAVNLTGNWTPLYVQNYVIGTGGLANSDWPKSGMNMNNTGQSIYVGPQTNNTKWTYATAPFYGSNSIAIGSDGTVYGGGSYINGPYGGYVYALNPDGTLNWTYVIGTSGGDRIDGSPCVGVDGTLYIGSYNGKLYAINSNGTLKWTYSIGGNLFGAPAIGADGTLYIGGTTGIFYAINPDGSLKWKYTMAYIYNSGSPAVGVDGTIYVGSTDDKLYALNPDGTLKWTYLTGDLVYGSATLGSDGTIYFGSADKHIYALNPDGTQKWNYTTGGAIRNSPAIGSDGIIYASSLNDNSVFALYPNGTLKWSYVAGGYLVGSPVISTDGTIYVGSNGDGKVYALNNNGTLKWTYTTGGSIYGSPAIGSDRTIYVGSDKIYAITDTLFTANQTIGFAPLTVQFNGITALPITSWSWNFGDGSTSMDQNPMHTYTSAGNYTVTLTMADSSGNNTVIVHQNSIKVYDAAVANFSLSTTWGTWPSADLYTYNSIQFTDTSSNVVSWYWSFGDGTTSTAQNPIHTYPVAGNYTVSLTATNPGGNNSSAINIQVTDTPLTVITNLAAGTYSTPQTLELVSNDPNSTVYYTNDTTDPRVSSTRIPYTAPITISNTTALRYSAVAPAGYWSQLYLQNYMIGNNSQSNVQWNLFENNLQHTGQSLTVGPGTNTTLWTYPTGNHIMYGSPVIGADGTVYVGSYDSKLYALNPDGSMKWNYTTGNYIYGSPAVGADGTIYVGSYDKKLYALNPDGSMKWNYTTGNYIYGSPAVGADGTIYIGSYDNKLYALDPNGTMKWNYTTGNHIYYGCPAIGSDETIYIGSYDKNLYALNPDGSMKWNFTTGNYIYGSASIGADGTVYVGSYDKKLYALDPNGTMKWNFTTGNYIYYGSCPAISADGTIYIGSYDGKLYALNPDGSMKWNFTTGNRIYGSAAIGADGTIYIGSYDKNLYALNTDGTLKWYYTTGNYIFGSPAIGSDGTLYIGSYDNNLYAIKDTLPIVDFTASSLTGLVPATVQFSDASKNSPTSWLWDFGDGNTSILQNPSHTYSAAGNYTVSLRTINLVGSNSTTKPDYITVSGSLVPEPSFSQDVTSGLAPVTVHFTGTATYSPTSWLWDFGDGTNSTLQNPAHVYSAVGNYTVSLTAFNANGNGTKVESDLISVILPSPSADFSVDHTWGVNNVTVRFTPVSPYATSWLWDFGDGSNSTEQYPTHTYTAVGSYNVSLTATNAAGNNTFVKTGCVIVRDGVLQTISPYNGVPIYVSNDAGIKYDIVGTCPYVPNTYYLGISGGLNAQHITGDPAVTAQVSVVTNQSGSFWITHTGGQATEHEAIIMLAVNGTIPDDFSVHINSSGYTWDLPWPPEYNNNQTTYNLAYVQGAVNETFYKSDFIYGPQTWKPMASANYPIYYGQNMSDVNNTFQIMFIDLDVGVYGSARVDYEFHNLTSYAVFNSYGWYSASSHGTGIIMTNDVVGGSTYGPSGYSVVGIPGVPVANFTYTTATSDVLSPVQFTDTSANFPQSWLWDFGDGTNSTLQNPVHTYGVAGNYTVSLTVTNLEGTNTTVGYVVKLNQHPPVPAFTSDVTSGVDPCLVQFTDQSNGTIISWLWDFGDGTNSTLQNPSHWYAPGNYTVNLTVTNSYGNASLVNTGYITVASNGQINQFVNPGFETGDMTGWTPISAGTASNLFAHTGSYSGRAYGINAGFQQIVDLTNVQSISFWTLLSNTSAGGRTSVYVDGVLIGQYQTTKKSTWVYQSYSVPSGYSGVHTVKFLQTLSGASYCIYIDDITAIPPPIASFTAMQVTGTAPLEVQFNDTSIRYPTSWLWDFGDGTNSTGQNATHTYTTAGTYTVNLTATNDGGSNTCSMTSYITVTAPPVVAPVASFTSNVTSGTAPLAVQFTDSSSNSPTSWSWDFGDGNTSVEQNPVYTYSVPGTYSVSLNASNAVGSNVTSIIDYITISTPAIIASFTANVTSGIAPLTVQFTDSSSNSPTSWSWDFGDGNTSAEQSPVYTYVTPGTYNVSLTASNAGGSNTSAMVNYISVNAQPSPSPSPVVPVASFSANVTSGQAPLTVQFTDSSSNSPTSWLWDFGDGSTSILQDPAHTYTNVGIYSVSLTVSNAYGNDSEVMTDYIKATKLVIPSNVSSSAPYFVKVANSEGAYADLYQNSTYAMYFNGGGFGMVFGNASGTISGSTKTASRGGNMLGNSSNGSFYLDFIGGRGGVEDVVLMLSLNGTVPDNFRVHINTSGYAMNYTNSGSSGNINGLSPSDLTYKANAVSEDFTKDDLLYGPQSYRPPSSTLIFNGENVSDPASQYQMMFIDTRLGIVGTAAPSTLLNAATVNNGSLRVDYSFENLGNCTAVFDAYGWIYSGSSSPASLNPSISWTNQGSDNDGQLMVQIPAVQTLSPVAGFSANVTSGVAPLSVQFTDVSSNSPTSWSWSFGDGNTSVEQNPVYTYFVPGSYDVSLTVSNAGGSNTTTMANYITVMNGSPSPSPSPSPVPGSYSLGLRQGWNLVSFPVVNMTLNSSALADAGVQTVSAFNASTGDYDSYIIGVSPSSFDITLRTDTGYFIYCTRDTSLDVLGSDPSSGRSTTINPGWNLLGWSSYTSSTAKGVAESLSGSQTVSRFNASTGDYDSYIEGVSPDSYDFALQAGSGYFVYTSSGLSQTLYYEVV
jgi:large repetitive protein